jgi:hypothetical protein
MENTIESFITEITEIDGQLDILLKKSWELLNDYEEKLKETDIFDKNITIEKYIDRYKELVINFDYMMFYVNSYRIDILELDYYIKFRKKYGTISDENLEKILDGSLTLKEKKELFKEFNAKEIIKKINEIRQDWNNTFNYKSYKNVKESIKNDSKRRYLRFAGPSAPLPKLMEDLNNMAKGESK